MNKFVLIKRKDGEFILRYANVDFHSQMVDNTDVVYGGGMFSFEDNNGVETMTLYGRSTDYGDPRWLDIFGVKISKAKAKIHIDEDLANCKIRWMSGYDDEWKPIYIDFTDKFIFDYWG